MIIFDTIKKYSDFFGNKTLHPLINYVDFSKSKPVPRTLARKGFYVIFIKETICGEFRYGKKHYDYSGGSMFFTGPNQIVGSEPEGEIYQPDGKAIIFHADLLNGTLLGKQIHEYSFFSYELNESLHLSDREREIVEGCFANIISEIGQNIDKHSKKLIVANLELLLKYCLRFYDRQFITRENANHGILEQFERKLNEYILNEDLKMNGLPSVAYFANELSLSPNYFGDLVKKETGNSPQDFIHLKLMELAKERVLDTTKSISEVSYELGFRYPQHFTRLFKQKVGLTPNEFRLN